MLPVNNALCRTLLSLAGFLLLLSTPTTHALVKSDFRMIAYMGNWQVCPTDEQLAGYTHLMIGFAITYQYEEAKNICNEDCIIAEPPVCDNGPFPALIDRYRATGGKVLLSFGGAGMGGSWEGDQNDCWDYCFGKDEYVVDRLVELNSKLNMDGVDLDYEYFYEDNQHGRGFTKGAQAIDFIRKVTVGLREKLPAGALVTHAPMDVDLVPGTAYFDLLKEIGDDTLDFLMPQYYNGNTRAMVDGFHRSGVGAMAAADHYKDLVDQVFRGDATRIVFGFCLEDCSASGSNADSGSALAVVDDLNRAYKCNGGVFFWALVDDVGNQWSTPVDRAMNFNRGCNYDSTGSNTVPTTPRPTQAPISYPPTRPYQPPATTDNGGFPDFFDPNNARSGSMHTTTFATLGWWSVCLTVTAALWNWMA